MSVRSFTGLRAAGPLPAGRLAAAAEIALVTEVLRRGERLQLAQAQRIRSLPRLDTADRAPLMP